MQLVLILVLSKWLHVEAAKFDLGFMVHLLNNLKEPDVDAFGVIISFRWILDNGYVEKGCSPYKYAQVGWAGKKNMSALYEIEKSATHPEIKKINLFRKAYNSDMFIGENFVVLHKTKEKMTISEGVVRPIKLNSGPMLPRKGVMVYYDHNAKITMKKINIIRHNSCFETFFQEHRMEDKSGQVQTIKEKLSKQLFCTDVKKFISGYQCCRSRAMLVADNILVGLMGWGTGCSPTYGVDPWVFTSVARYFWWIVNTANVHFEKHPMYVYSD